MPSKKESRSKTLDDYLFDGPFPEAQMKELFSREPVAIVTAAQVRKINREIQMVVRQNQAEYQAGLDEGMSQTAR